MPEKETYSNIDKEHVKGLAEQLKFQMETVDLSKPLGALYEAIPDFNPEDRLSRGNLKARMRMLVLYYFANRQNLLVAGSSDKSETMIGYFTKWGDGGTDIAPIRGLYKTQVRELASYLGLPPHIIKKPSTPGLWPNQRAGTEIGLKYRTLDLVLYGLEHSMSIESIARQLHLTRQTVLKVRRRLLRTEHKRQMPAAPKI